MTSKNWPRRSVLVCGIISLLGSCAAAQSPAIALMDPADAPQWQAWAKDSGWRVIAGAPAGNADARIQALERAVRDAVRAGGVDPGRVYLAGRGDAAAAVFYCISRIPD